MQTQQKKPNSDQLLVREAAVETEMIDVSSAAVPGLLSLEDVHQQLKDVRQEAEEAYASDDKIDPVPETAYNNALSLLEALSVRNIPMPEIGWAEDGSLGFEWRPEDGIATMGLYGDSLIIYTAFFGEERQVEGVCALSDKPMLAGFLGLLR